MDPDLRQQMNAYYDERAGEYEELYTLGFGPGSVSAPNAYQAEAQALATLVGKFGQGDLLDIACGTGYWLPHYAGGCESVTLLDQSANMLAEAQRKVESLDIAGKCTLIRGDFFDYPFAVGAYDTALVGFFFSHLRDEQEPTFLVALKRMLRPDGAFLILDSLWSDERARTRDKAGPHQRTLNDGRTFEIYKRYFTPEDFAALAKRYDLDISVVHAGRVFIAARGRFA